jgi:hypothetical protein
MKVYIVTKDRCNDQSYEDSIQEYNVFVGAYCSLEQARAAIMEMTTKENFYPERDLVECRSEMAEEGYSEEAINYWIERFKKEFESALYERMVNETVEMNGNRYGGVVVVTYERYGIMTETYSVIVCEI